MSDNKPTNILQFGNRKPAQSAPGVDKKIVDQDPLHAPRSVSKELIHTVKAGTDQEVAENIKAIRSHYLDIVSAEKSTLPMLILVNSCEFPGATDEPAAELLALRRRFVTTVNTYFGQPNKVAKNIIDAGDEFFMQVRLLMFVDNSHTGHRLADEGAIGLRLNICEFGVVTTWTVGGFPDHSQFFPLFPA